MLNKKKKVTGYMCPAKFINLKKLSIFNNELQRSENQTKSAMRQN